MYEHVFRIFVNGRRPDPSVRALRALAQLCRRHYAGRFQIIPVDIHVNPEQLRRYGVSAAPTVVRVSPLPLVRLVGDLSDVRSVREMLGLTAAEG